MNWILCCLKIYLYLFYISGDWSRTDHRPDDSDIDDDGDVYDDEDDDVGYMVIDEDADIDESCDGVDEECPAVQQVSSASGR